MKLKFPADERIDRPVRCLLKAVVEVEHRACVSRKAEGSALGSLRDPRHDGIMTKPRIDAVDAFNQIKDCALVTAASGAGVLISQDVPMASNLKLEVSTLSPDVVGSKLSRAKPLHHCRIAMVEEAAGLLIE